MALLQRSSIPRRGTPTQPAWNCRRPTARKRFWPRHCHPWRMALLSTCAVILGPRTVQWRSQRAPVATQWPAAGRSRVSGRRDRIYGTREGIGRYSRTWHSDINRILYSGMLNTWTVEEGKGKENKCMVISKQCCAFFRVIKKSFLSNWFE